MSQIESYFPGLRSSAYRVMSPKSVVYNCIAWAAGDSGMWWWPDRQGQYFWPHDVPRRATLDAFAQAYAQHGYDPCSSPDFEPGFEKIAVFVGADGEPTHAARQLSTGRWTSKLGRSEDIEHDLEALEGSRYGSVALIVKRPRRQAADAAQEH